MDCDLGHASQCKVLREDASSNKRFLCSRVDKGWNNDAAFLSVRCILHLAGSRQQTGSEQMTASLMAAAQREDEGLDDADSAMLDEEDLDALE